MRICTYEIISQNSLKNIEELEPCRTCDDDYKLHCKWYKPTPKENDCWEYYETGESEE